MEEGAIRLKKAEEAELKHHSRRLSIKEGIFFSTRVSCGDKFISPLAVSLGAPNAIVSILSSLWSLGPASQCFGAKLVGKIKRKKILTRFIGIEVFGWIMMFLTTLAYFQNLYVEYLPYVMLLNLAIIVVSNGISNPAWFSWMGDLVDSKYRGRWFSKRSTIISFTTIILATLASLLLNHFKNLGKPQLGFVILFGIALLARTQCVRIFAKQYEPKEKTKKKSKYTFKQFIQESKHTNFGKFALFRTIFAASMTLSSSLTSIYLLRFLEFDYISYMAIMLSSTLFSIFLLNFWGKLADKYGNYKVIAITTLLIPLNPVLFILSSSKIYLFLVPALIAGTSYAAFILASNNFIYDNVKKEKIGKAISYFNLLVGSAAFIGGLIGATLIETIHTTWIEPIKLIFIIGTMLRLLVVAFWIPQLKEIKKKKELTSIKDFEKEFRKDIKPVLTEDAHEIMGIAGYIKEK